MYAVWQLCGQNADELHEKEERGEENHSRFGEGSAAATLVAARAGAAT